MGKLNDKAIQAAKPREKQYKLTDGDGLTLIVQPTGKKLWWQRYRFGGKEKTFSLGPYPLIGLKDARAKSFEARRLVFDGIDPSKARQAVRAAQAESAKAAGETVEVISREWFQKFSPQWVDSHADRIIRRLEKDVFPFIGNRAIRSVTPVQLLEVLRRVESRGAVETTHRVLQNCGQVWRYAVATGRVERDISGDLKGAIPPAKVKNLGAVVEPAEIGVLLRNIDEYHGSNVVKAALKLAPLVFLRPGELRHAEWDEFDFTNNEWKIPAEKMKGKRPHVVPLSTQTLALLTELRHLTGEGQYLFPASNSRTRPISDMALLSAIRRMGYGKEEMTAHGFRAMASTNLENLGYDVRLIELQLAHVDQNEVRAAYKRDVSRLQLEQRSKMMQHWADYLDELKAGAKILPFRAA
jgi:integrase